MVHTFTETCSCGMKTDITYHDDGHAERSRPRHCDQCHSEDYEDIWFLCRECSALVSVELDLQKDKPNI